MLKHKWIDYYLHMAELTASLSSAQRLKVGCVIVRDNHVLATGYNGTPAGWDNSCEDIEHTYDVRDTYHFGEWKYDSATKQYSRLVTKDIVLHSEMNALMRLTRSTESSEGAAMFCTHAPCIHCAKAIYQAGISHVYYRNAYRDNRGIDFLNDCGLGVIHYTDSTHNND